MKSARPQVKSEEIQLFKRDIGEWDVFIGGGLVLDVSAKSQFISESHLLSHEIPGELTQNIL